MLADRFSFDLGLAEWVFTLALGIPAGLALAGLWMATRDWRGGWRWPGILLAILGAAGLFAVAALPVDRLPLNLLPIRLKLYLSDATVAAALDAAFALGLAAGAAIALLVRRLVRPLRLWPSATAGIQVGAVGIAVVAAVAWANHESTPGRHPAGTRTSGAASADSIVEAEMVTGLAIGPAGEVVFVELGGGRLTIRDAAGKREIPLAVPEAGQTFHVALHPGWPREPYAYVTVSKPAGEGREMQVLRVRTDGQASVEAEVTGLPISRPDEGNHYGSALAFCNGALFVSTGDTDHIFLGPRSEISGRAQSPFAAEGKVLRYRLQGAELVPDGVNGNQPPVFAMGFRNPFGMGCDTERGLPIVAENGIGTNDQVRLVEAGSNHEWPFSDARDTRGEPLFDTGNRTIAPTGVAIRSRAGGREIILGAFKSGGLYALALDEAGRVKGPPRLLREFEYGVLAVALDASGCIYATDPFAIWRIIEDGCP